MLNGTCRHHSPESTTTDHISHQREYQQGLNCGRCNNVQECQAVEGDLRGGRGMGLDPAPQLGQGYLQTSQGCWQMPPEVCLIRHQSDVSIFTAVMRDTDHNVAMQQ